MDNLIDQLSEIVGKDGISSGSDLAGTLSAFEVMWINYFSSVTVAGAHKAPLARDYPYYVLNPGNVID